jgi:transposase InsO family protein
MPTMAVSILRSPLGKRCEQVGVRPSRASVGDCFDNARCESFLATLEGELLDRRRFKTQSEARIAIFEFIEGWYNPRRRHSALDICRQSERSHSKDTGYRSPTPSIEPG